MARGKKGKSGKSNRSKEPKEMYQRGVGEFTMENGDRYSGEYCAHRFGLVWREGRGTYTTHDGQVYAGTWKDDKLMDNEPVKISYQNGHEFCGVLSKNKYSGPGSYYIKEDMVVTCSFAANQPNGDTMLVDKRQRLWCGLSEPKENYSVLRPKNVFFEYLGEEEGRGRKKIKEREPSRKKVSSDISVAEKLLYFKEEEESDKWKEYRKVEGEVFKKTGKTENDVDFAKSEWYQNYMRYVVKRENIRATLEEFGVDGLTKEQKSWLCWYRDWKYLRLLRDAYKQLKRNDESVNAKLPDTFYGKTNEVNSLGIPTVTPRWKWDTFFKGNGWNSQYVPAKRCSEDVFDSSCSSVREILCPEDESAKRDHSVQVNIDTEPSVPGSEPSDGNTDDDSLVNN